MLLRDCVCFVLFSLDLQVLAPINLATKSLPLSMYQAGILLFREKKKHLYYSSTDISVKHHWIPIAWWICHNPIAVNSDLGSLWKREARKTGVVRLSYASRWNEDVWYTYLQKLLDRELRKKVVGEHHDVCTHDGDCLRHSRKYQIKWPYLTSPWSHQIHKLSDGVEVYPMTTKAESTAIMEKSLQDTWRSISFTSQREHKEMEEESPRSRGVTWSKISGLLLKD